MLEPRFTAETLSALLSIPPGKTLLRRHLATHFNSLIGVECQKVKEQTQNAPGFVPLMPGAKVKVSRQSHKTANNTGAKDQLKVIGN